MISLNNYNTFITGASRGIGRGIALKLADAGSNIGFTFASNESKALELEKELQAKGVKAKAYQSDASDFQSCEQTCAQFIKDFDGKIDVCVNNAGISKDNLLLRMTQEQWESTIKTNLDSVFNVTKQFLRYMLKQRQGSIINVSSIIGIRGNAGQASYAASKGGINAFTKSIAQELASRNIRCNAIAPGFVETDMTNYLSDGNQTEEYKKNIPLGRFGNVEDIANTVAFFASPLSSYITGQVVSVCGGLNI